MSGTVISTVDNGGRSPQRNQFHLLTSWRCCTATRKRAYERSTQDCGVRLLGWTKNCCAFPSMKCIKTRRAEVDACLFPRLFASPLCTNLRHHTLLGTRILRRPESSPTLPTRKWKFWINRTSTKWCDAPTVNCITALHNSDALLYYPAQQLTHTEH